MDESRQDQRFEVGTLLTPLDSDKPIPWTWHRHALFRIESISGTRAMFVRLSLTRDYSKDPSNDWVLFVNSSPDYTMKTTKIFRYFEHADPAVFINMLLKAGKILKN